MDGVTWRNIGAVWRIFRDFPLKCFQQVEDLLGHMWRSIVLEQEFLFREFAFGLVFDDMSKLRQRLKYTAKKMDTSSSYWSAGLNHAPDLARQFSPKWKRKEKPFASANCEKHRAIYLAKYLHTSIRYNATTVKMLFSFGQSIG